MDTTSEKANNRLLTKFNCLANNKYLDYTKRRVRSSINISVHVV